VFGRVARGASPAEVHPYKQWEAIILPPAPDEGTPTQKDEAMAENPPIGAIVDYYLKSAANGPLTIEILNGSGGVVRHVSSADPVPAIEPTSLFVNAVWQRPQESPSAAAGLHRYVWDFRPDPPPGGGGRGRGGRGGGGGGGGGGRGGPPPVAPGNYSIRLTVNGQSLTQPLVVKPDPRER